MTVSQSPARPEVTILDVGHGNAAVLRCGGGTVVVDAAPGVTLPNELERTSTRHLEHLVLSHADKDHIGGAVGLLSGSLSVGTLWFNPDAVKQTDVFDDLRALAFNLHEAGRIQVSTNLNSGARAALSLEGMDVDVVHPDILGASTGPRPSGHRHGSATANSVSAVLRVVVQGAGEVLLCADLNAEGLRTLLSRGIDLSARVLVFPHHGGRSGGDDRAFARELCAAVSPEIVIFSLARGGFLNPQPDIVAGVRDAIPSAHIACTQLSARCQPNDVREEPSHLAPRPAAGRAGIACCGGSLVIAAGDAREDLPQLSRHAAFITDAVPTPLCRL